MESFHFTHEAHRKPRFGHQTHFPKPPETGHQNAPVAGKPPVVASDGRPGCSASTLLCAPRWAWPALLRARDILRDAAEVPPSDERHGGGGGGGIPRCEGKHMGSTGEILGVGGSFSGCVVGKLGFPEILQVEGCKLLSRFVRLGHSIVGSLQYGFIVFCFFPFGLLRRKERQPPKSTISPPPPNPKPPTPPLSLRTSSVTSCGPRPPSPWPGSRAAACPCTRTTAAATWRSAT